jgi:Mg2+ and Co2+ transporter CorA
MNDSRFNFVAFDNLTSFSKAVESVVGEELDFQSVIDLGTDFIQPSNEYLVLNVKEFDGKAPDNILFLSQDKAYVFSKEIPSTEIVKEFEEVLQNPFGKSTVLAFLIISKVMEKHKQHIEVLIKMIRDLEDAFDHSKYRNLALEFERFSDRLEEFHDMLLRLQERRYREIDTQLISFDYGVVIAESLSLQARCRRRLNTLKELRQDHEILATEELNKRMVKLNDVVKKLTALTVILMLPTLIASHFGMNFVFMPELKQEWAYPAVIVFQIVFMAVGFGIFRKIGWL